MRYFRLCLLSAIIILLPVLPAGAGPVDDLAALQKDITTIRAPFKQKKHTELLPRPVKSKGTFYFKAGAGVRWEYDGSMVVVYDGDTLYLHYTEMDEVEKVKGVAGFSGPLSFNVKELARDYRIKATRAASGDITLDLVPREPMPFVSMTMIFRAGQGFPMEVHVYEESGDETVISFVEPEFALALKDSMFVFTPPKGVVVRERSYK